MTSARGIEDELSRIGFMSPDRGFPGWTREGVGVEVFDHPKRGEVEVMVWVIGSEGKAHELVAERSSPTIRWVRDAIRRAEQPRPTEEERGFARASSATAARRWVNL